MTPRRPKLQTAGKGALDRAAAGDAKAPRRRTWLRMGVGGAALAVALAAVAGLTAAPAVPPPAAGGNSAAAPTTSPATASAAPVTTAAPLGYPPLHIAYPAIGMDQDILPLNQPNEGQATIVPPMTTAAYWLSPYGSPGSSDTTYVVGHSWQGLDTPFNHLSSHARPGDKIVVTTAAGPGTYTVRGISTEDKNTLKDSSIWGKVPNRLILVSCYTEDLRGTNIVVTADLTPAP